MLSIAISTFFALAFFGAATVIAMMFFRYRDKIVSVVQNELKAGQSEAVLGPTACRHRIVRAPQLLMTQKNRSLKPVPLRVAA